MAWHDTAAATEKAAGVWRHGRKSYSLSRPVGGSGLAPTVRTTTIAEMADGAQKVTVKIGGELVFTHIYRPSPNPNHYTNRLHKDAS